MSDATLKQSLEGRIRNLRHFKPEALLPLFEAIVNSIQAIEEAGDITKGKVVVKIKRDTRQSMLKFSDHEILPNIIGFEIEDNGIGFNNKNYESFQTADSTYKLQKGGKGVGRFLWLKAFEKVEVVSIFRGEDNSFYEREFDFTVKKGVKQKSLKKSRAVEKTIVRLMGFDEDYRKQPSAYKTASKIAQRIFEHCLTRFISGLAPDIYVVDDADSSKISLYSLYNEIQDNIVTDHFAINDKKFNLHHIRLYSTRSQTHQLVYCAHGRDVKSRQIGKLFGTSIQFDDDGKKFFYSAYVTSPFLDEKVDQYRQEFDIQDKPNLITGEDITMELIEGKVLSLSKIHLAHVIESIEAQKADKVSKYIQNESPMLRAVMKYCPEAMTDIELNTSDEKMAQTLYSYKGKAEYEIKKNSEKLLRSQAKSIDEIKSQYDELSQKLEDFQKDQLAGYVVFRKMIIDLLDKKLSLNTEGKYHNEDIVHDIIFPRKADSDTIGYDNHNLWLIDELLSFHSFAPSDKRLCDFTTSLSEERPDVLIFSEVGDDRRARSISVLEFKKPQRTNFDEDPTKQLFRYVREVRKSGVWLPTGRKITVDSTTRFYCYAICDITPQIVEFAENGNYASLQGEFGFYNYNRVHNAHVEIVAFDKIVIDAKQRHKAFFENLGIGS